MNDLLQQRFFRLLSEYSQREVFATELVGAIEELALHLADFSMYEQDNSILLRYFSFGLVLFFYTFKIKNVEKPCRLSRFLV